MMSLSSQKLCDTKVRTKFMVILSHQEACTTNIR